MNLRARSASPVVTSALLIALTAGCTHSSPTAAPHPRPFGASGSPGGIPLLNGTTVTFGDDAPHVLFRHVHRVTAHHTLLVVLQFEAAGLLRVQARVAVGEPAPGRSAPLTRFA
ncbi:hypothetical protein DI272_09775 [Streptomyces sp. Act143]|nr:hypothetical protein DI272_09775 [Streptomyces sp. Act143]